MQKSKEEYYKEQDNRINTRMSKIKHTILVMSGKGGVGKSTVAVNLAYALCLENYEVGILDVDIHGPNIAKMLGIENRQIGVTGIDIEPVKVLPNLKAVSLAVIGVGVNQAIIWRGPMKANMIRQFLSDVNWEELDFLIIDSPPGTGDEPLSVCQLIPNISGIIIVTTPQDLAILDALRSIAFAKTIDKPVIGIIENMSGFVCPHCKKEIDIFKKGGGEKLADKMKVPFLGRIPFEPKFVEFGDRGMPFASRAESSVDQGLSSNSFAPIVHRIKQFVEHKSVCR
ncbi:MAG: Mrp/NBP35 family ATP-binding protein [Candidatus Hydrogenedentota bacterium]